MQRPFKMTTLIVLTALVLSLQVAAQNQRAAIHTKHRSYKVIDIGTFGGRASYINPTFQLGAPNQMNPRGATVGAAATSIPTPLAGCPFCNGLDGQVHNVFHAFKWSAGIAKDLGALPGELTNSIAISINAEGSVVGHSENGEIDPLTGAREFRAVLWKDGRITNLGTFGGNHSVGGTINDRGQIAGAALNAAPDPFSMIGTILLGSSNSTQTRAFLWENGHKRDLGTLGGPDSFGFTVNERGEVIGSSYTNSLPNPTTGIPTVHPFLWRKGNMIDLGTLGGTLGGPGALNNRGQVIGQSNLEGDQFPDPFLWEDGKLIDLHTGTIGGNPYTANALNDAGQIVGAGAFPDHPYDAYVWEKGVARDLGYLDGDCYSEAFLINSKGQIAGQSYSCDVTTARPFLWQDGILYELNRLIPSSSDFKFTQAFVINDRDEIGGIGTPAGCDFDLDCGHALVLIPCGSDDNDLACNEAAENAATATAVGLSPTRQSPVSRSLNLRGRELAIRLQSQFGRTQGWRLPGLK